MRHLGNILLIFIVFFFSYNLNNIIVLTDASRQEEWEDVGLEWYYDNLTDENRKKIRQAIDYCIPRQQVIEEIMQGYAAPLATEIGQNIVGYDPSIQHRPYNLTRAGELLTEVFGKIYSDTEDPSDVYTNVPYFHMTIICPTADISRSQWASQISYALNNLGIEIDLKWWNWNIFLPRIFFDPKTDPLGANYDHGGFDAYFCSFNTTANPDYSGQYYPEFFTPVGNNSMYIERPDLMEIINRSLQEPKFEDRTVALGDYQEWFYEWVPKCIIHQGLDIFPQSPVWEGFDTYNYGRNPWVHNMTQATYNPEATYTSIVSGNFVDFNPMISKRWYDAVWQSNVFLSLAARRGIYNLSHPYPQLAKSWVSTPDGLQWTVNLRQGVKWHDGSELTADDVIFSYQAAYDCPYSAWASDMAIWFDSNSNWIQKVDKYTVKFTFRKFYPYVESRSFAIPILSEDQMGAITYADWRTHDTNTGAAQLYGTGPYEFTSFSVISGVTCDKFTYWNASLMDHNPTAVGGGIWLDSTYGPQTYKTVVNLEPETSIIALEKGEVQLLDPNLNIFGQIGELETVSWCNLITSLEYGGEELAFNHYDPRWGLNPHDPREMYPEDYPSKTYTSTTTSTTTTTTIITTTKDNITSGYELMIAVIIFTFQIVIRRFVNKKSMNRQKRQN